MLRAKLGNLEYVPFLNWCPRKNHNREQAIYHHRPFDHIVLSNRKAHSLAELFIVVCEICCSLLIKPVFNFLCMTENRTAGMLRRLWYLIVSGQWLPEGDTVPCYMLKSIMHV
jgi:hypothetical protein